jgi:putative transposase
MKSRFTAEQIIRILQQGEAGSKVKDIVREHGITEQTYYRWRSKYGGMQVSEAKRLRELESENLKLKQLLGEKDLQLLAVQEVLRKNL